jgi:hypothetical protein
VALMGYVITITEAVPCLPTFVPRATTR